MNVVALAAVFVLLMVPLVAAHEGEVQTGAEYEMEAAASGFAYDAGRAIGAGVVLLAILFGFWLRGLMGGSGRMDKGERRFLQGFRYVVAAVIGVSAALYALSGFSVLLIWVIIVLSLVFSVLYLSLRYGKR